MQAAHIQLSDAKTGNRAVVRRIERGGMGIRRRLLEMGLIRDSEILLVRRAPLGDPIEIRIRGYHLSLRREEAASVIVEIVNESEPPHS